MRELKCPKCGNVFSVDEADYASIVNQVKGAHAASHQCFADISAHTADAKHRYTGALQAVNTFFAEQQLRS